MFKRCSKLIRRLLRPRRKASLQQVAECRVIASLDEALNASLAAGDYRQVQVDWSAVA